MSFSRPLLESDDFPDMEDSFDITNKIQPQEEIHLSDFELNEIPAVDAYEARVQENISHAVVLSKLKKIEKDAKEVDVQTNKLQKNLQQAKETLEEIKKEWKEKLNENKQNKSVNAATKLSKSSIFTKRKSVEKETIKLKKKKAKR